MEIVATNIKTTIKQINWLIFCIVLYYCSMLEERTIDEYTQVCKWYDSKVLLRLYLYIDRQTRRYTHRKTPYFHEWRGTDVLFLVGGQPM